MGYRHVFGPVTSGRLGRSLGLDLLGGTVCSLDCLYCESGPTTRLTLERREWVPVADLLDELHAWKQAGHVPPEVITLGGAGEPTLHDGIPAIAAGARRLFPGLPVAILTNSTLLSDPAARRDLLDLDLVLPSMDALTPAAFRRLNRPHPRLDLQAMAQGLLDFRAEFAGVLRLEVLLCQGVNDDEENLALLRDYVARLRPEAVDVTTLSRPGAHAGARAVPPETLARWREALGGEAMASRDAKFPGLEAEGQPEQLENIAEMLLASLRRRPQTIPQLAQGLGISPAMAAEVLEKLRNSGHVMDRGPREAHPSHHFFSAG